MWIIFQYEHLCSKIIFCIWNCQYNGYHAMTIILDRQLQIRLPLPPPPFLSLFVLCEYVVYACLLIKLIWSKCLLEKELISRNYSFQKSLVMRIRIAYKVNGKDTLEEGQISNFPKGLWSQKYGRVIKVIHKTHCFCLHSKILVQFSCLIPSNEKVWLRQMGSTF